MIIHSFAPVKVSILSDTHGYMDDRIIHYLEGSDVIIHAGDVGDNGVLDQLEQVAPTKCVFGNIDGNAIRARCSEWELLDLVGHKILLIHIAGAMGRYNEMTRDLIRSHQPDTLICGHSHILKVMPDRKFNLLHINPGAAGRHGFQKIRTLLKMEILDGKLHNLQAIELGPRSSKSIS